MSNLEEKYLDKAGLYALLLRVAKMYSQLSGKNPKELIAGSGINIALPAEDDWDNIEEISIDEIYLETVLAGAITNEITEGDLIYTTTSDNQEVVITSHIEYFSALNIDGEEIEISSSDEGTYYYTFEKAGKHYVSVAFVNGLTTAYSMFRDCTELTEVCNEQLFEAAADIEDFNYTFYGCTGLTSIPENIFSSNLNIANMWGTFWNCSSLTPVVYVYATSVGTAMMFGFGTAETGTVYVIEGTQTDTAFSLGTAYVNVEYI